MINPLDELSDIYLGQISEADNSPEAIKARVMQHVRAIRYRARKEGDQLTKAYNDYMAGQAGISATEKSMVKERLGLTGGAQHQEGMAYGLSRGTGKPSGPMAAFGKAPRTQKGAMAYDGPNKASSEAKDRVIAKTKAKRKKPTVTIDKPDKLVSLRVSKEGYYSWRHELSEYSGMMPKKNGDAEEKITEKKVKNKVTVNPAQGQAESFAKELGGQLLEACEVFQMFELDNGEIQLLEVKDRKGKGSGSKDACYHKVKSRYSVWPSAYASGALVKCRRVGAANWGNSTKKEDVQWKDIQYKAKSGESSFLSDSDGNIAFEIVDVVVPAVKEAKVDTGRSDYGKASIRNYRRMGPGHGEPGMFDPEGKRGKTIDKRREEHKARRGVKGAKVPAYKVEEGKEEGGYISNVSKAEVRNQRRFGDKGSTEPTGRTGQGISSAAKMAVKRGEEHKARRGVKTKGMSEDYETKKKEEIMGALKKRDLKQKVKEKIAADIIKRKGDVSKSDDRYAYESVEVEQIDELKDTTLQSYIDKAQPASRSLSSRRAVARKKQGIDRAKDTITGTKRKRPKSRYDIKNYEGQKKNYLMGKEDRKGHEDYGKIPRAGQSEQVEVVSEGPLGALAGGALGAAVGGPVGALAGAALGSKVDVLGGGKKKTKATKPTPAPKPDPKPFKNVEAEKAKAAKRARLVRIMSKEKLNKEGYSNWRDTLDEKCWAGYEKKGMKTMFGKRYPNCVKKKTKSEEVEFQEKLDLKKADMGDVVKDFYKSDAPQFKGRSKEKRREMAIAAKLTAERGKLPEEVVTEVSKKTLGSYVKKASTDLATRSIKHGMTGGTETGGDPDSSENVEKINKRHSGIMKAVDKLKKESFSANPAQQAAIAIAKKERKQDLKVAQKKKMKEEVIDEKIKYDKSGSSMDYFLGSDPKKTKYYKDTVKKKTKKEEVVTELNRFEKEKGMDTKTGKPVTKGGTAKNDRAFQSVMKKFGKQRMGANQPKKVRGAKNPNETSPTKQKMTRMKAAKASSRAFETRAKRAGYKTAQDYANVVARYGSEDNMKKGRGLGT